MICSKKVSVATFKIKAHSLISEVERKHRELVLTRRGVPIVKIIPYIETREELGGSLKGRAEIVGDIIHLTTGSWAKF